MKIVAYIADWGFHEDVAPEQAARLTDVRYAFGLIKDGRADISSLQELPRLRRHMLKYPHIQWLLSIGGWGAGGFSEAVATDAGRELLSETAVRILEENGFDGLDWDWEYPTSDAAKITCAPDDNINMTDLLVLTRKKLDALSLRTNRAYQQTIAVGAGDERLGDYDWARAVPALDSVGLMTYDMSMSGRAGHVANLYPSKNAAYSAHQAVEAFHAAGVPFDKLLIGCAFYFHGYTGDFPADAPFLAPIRERVRGGAYCALESKLPSLRRCYDEQAQASAYLDNGLFLTGDDPDSIRAKRRYILERGLGGTIIWELNHDRSGALCKALCGEE